MMHGTTNIKYHSGYTTDQLHKNEEKNIKYHSGYTTDQLHKNEEKNSILL